MERLSIIANHLSEPLVKVQQLPEKIAIISLNRPSKLNSLSIELWDELNKELTRLEEDPNIHVMVLTGNGKAFCAGADINGFLKLTPGITAIKNPLEIWPSVLPKLRKPIIAAVNGLALGGGCEIAMMCDIIIADKTAKFGQPEVKLGIIPGSGGTQRLTKAIGKSRSMKMILTGDPITAEEAKAYGLISNIADKNALEEAIALATKMAKYSLQTLCLCRKAVNASFEVGLSQGIQHELSLFNHSLSLNDAKEGCKALLEKRPAKFTNS